MAVYIDVTRLLVWRGNYTGMERLAYEITNALLQAESGLDIKLCCYIRGQGHKGIGTLFEIKDGRLTSPLLEPSPSLKQLAKDDKKAFVVHYAKRLRRQRQNKRLPQLLLSPQDTLLILDGLWDQQSYIDSVKTLVGQGARLAHVVCDAVPVIMPQVCFDFVTDAFDSYFKQVTPHIDAFLAISKNTMKDFETTYTGLMKPSASKKVIRLADDFNRHAKPKKPDSVACKPGGYFLTVGTVEIRKNHALLHQAYRLAAEKGIELPPLVVAGREGWLAEATVYSLKRDPIVKDKIVFAGPVTDAQLSWLYGNCLATVFPSLYEGWGLPVAESLFYGKTCGASSASSIPEVGKDLSLYYSPYNAEECLGVLVRLLDLAVIKKLERRIRDTYTPTLWSQTAKEIITQLKGRG